MSTVYPFRYEGGGVFRCLRPTAITLEAGSVHGWQMAEHRSPETHKHYFAIIKDAWANLPEAIAGEFPSPEHLRKWALVRAGYADITKMTLPTNADAVNAAGLMTKMDHFAVVEISGRVVTVGRAHSQNTRAMGKQAFAESKEAVFNIISALIGADVTAMEQAA